jgi:hypothetical protein
MEAVPRGVLVNSKSLELRSETDSVMRSEHVVGDLLRAERL